jgi:rhodanese-related sulfurtransferase
MAQVDYEMAGYIHEKAKEHGIHIFLETGVKKFVESGEKIHVFTNTETILETDVVILAMGVKPENKLALQANLEIGSTGGIRVNPYLQTSDEDIYAVGDAIEVTHYIHHQKLHIPLAWPANRQGRIVADNVFYGNITPYTGSLGSSILKFFELSVAATGLTEKMLKRLEIDYHSIMVTKGHHAGYYPGAKDILLKVLFDGEGNILGGQAVGEQGADKRIDIIATAIKAKMKVWELQDIEITYAPSFNSAKDLVNIAGYGAENILKGDLHVINYDQLDTYVNIHHAIILDVRTREEFITGHIENAVNIPVDDLRSSLPELDKNRHYIVYCQVGLRGYLAHRILKNNGYHVQNLNGGFNVWNKVYPKLTESALQ